MTQSNASQASEMALVRYIKPRLSLGDQMDLKLSYHSDSDVEETPSKTRTCSTFKSNVQCFTGVSCDRNKELGWECVSIFNMYFVVGDIRVVPRIAVVGIV